MPKYNEIKWGVHVLGPDDIHPCRDFEHANSLAHKMNKTVVEVCETMDKNFGKSDDDPLVYAVMFEWDEAVDGEHKSEDVDQDDSIHEAMGIPEKTNNDLLECPHCGCEYAVIKKSKLGRMAVQCLNTGCGAQSGCADTEDEVRKLWNRRDHEDRFERDGTAKVYRIGMSLPEIIFAGWHHGDMSLGCKLEAEGQGYDVELVYVCEQWRRLDKRWYPSQKKETT